MQLKADNNSGTYTLTLEGAPAGGVAELRFQNTFNGATEVRTVDVGSQGTAVVDTPRNFGQNFKVSVVVLTNTSDDTYDLLYAPVAKDDTTGNLLLVDKSTFDSMVAAQPVPAEKAVATHSMVAGDNAPPSGDRTSAPAQ